jgi:hypothetical protein
MTNSSGASLFASSVASAYAADLSSPVKTVLGQAQAGRDEPSFVNGRFADGRWVTSA